MIVARAHRPEGVHEAKYASRPRNVPKSSYTGTVLTAFQRRRIRVDSSAPQVKPALSEPSGPEITPSAPNPRGRKMLVVLIVVAIIIIAGLATFFVLYLGSGSVFVTSNSQFIPAGGSTTFTATVTPPPFVSSTGTQWDFGDGSKQSSTGDTIAHTYANPGNYFVLSTASFSNGKNVGDGTAPVTNASADPFPVTHTYATGGIFAATLQVTTGNFSAAQTNGTPANPTPTPTGATLITTVGLTVAGGAYKEITYSGNVIKPGIITNMEAVTGGDTTPDPPLHYESTGFEVISNVYETLPAYNPTSTQNFVPVVSNQIPTAANGQGSADFMNYTFHIRPGLKFSNGDAITAWDVKYSITRTLLFNSGSPLPPGWITPQFLVPTTFISGLTTPSGCQLGKP